MSVQPQTNLPIAWNLQPLIPHSGTLPGRRCTICPRWCHTAFGARYQNRTGTYCLEGSRSAINLIRHTPARRRASRKEEVEKGGYESAQSVVNSTLCVHFTAILIVRSTFKWRNKNFFQQFETFFDGVLNAFSTLHPIKSNLEKIVCSLIPKMDAHSATL